MIKIEATNEKKKSLYGLVLLSHYIEIKGGKQNEIGY